MEFPENIAKQLDGDSVGVIRAWRHQMICKLIEAGVVDPKEIKDTVSTLYDFVVSPHKKDNTEVERTNKERERLTLLSRQTDGHQLLKKLLNQANLTKDQLDCINLFIFPQKK